jgi:ketosteroid isomerase-like protein
MRALACLLLFCACARAQQVDVRPIQGYFDGWARNDVDAVLESWSDDAEYSDPLIGAIKGKENIRTYFKKLADGKITALKAQ